MYTTADGYYDFADRPVLKVIYERAIPPPPASFVDISTNAIEYPRAEL